jgi:hypothetical protein
MANYRVSTENKYNKQNKTHIKKTRQGKSNKNKYNNNNNEISNSSAVPMPLLIYSQANGRTKQSVQ